jgi:carboxysome peptide B
VDIFKVVSSLVCTSRVPGLLKMDLKVLEDAKGRLQVAVDPVSARPGNWVFTASGSAARYAAGDFETHTDLTICGIIDFWDDEASPATQTTAKTGS